MLRGVVSVDEEGDWRNPGLQIFMERARTSSGVEPGGTRIARMAGTLSLASNSGVASPTSWTKSSPTNSAVRLISSAPALTKTPDGGRRFDRRQASDLAHDLCRRLRAYLPR